MNRIKWLVINVLSLAVFAVGCFFVWLYTILFRGGKDMAANPTNPNVPDVPPAHLLYPPPTQEQAFDAATHVGKALVGQEPKDKDFAWHLTTVIDYGVAMGLGIKAPVFTAAADINEQAKDLFGPLATAEAAPADAGVFPWAQALTIALQLLLEWLRSRGA